MENSSRIVSEIFIFRVVTEAVLLENSFNYFSIITIISNHLNTEELSKSLYFYYRNKP